MNIAIYGAGEAGQLVFDTIVSSGYGSVACFIDDDPKSQKTLNGLPIIRPDRFSETLQSISVDEIIVAIPSASKADTALIVAGLLQFAIPIQVLPDKATIKRIISSSQTGYSIDELVGRRTKTLAGESITQWFSGSVVLVAGAGGSIGFELCKKLISFNPTRVLLVEQNEYSLYHSERTLKLNLPQTCELVPLLVSATDRTILEKIFYKWQPDYVFHAAAYKHVPLVEGNVLAALRNNINSTEVLATLSGRFGVKNFVLISSDKAVRPTSLMGVTKRITEIICGITGLEFPNTKFCAVRFGNVLESSGSVIPLFKEQIQNGGPVTVTHPDMVRYFMTIDEACDLVLHVGPITTGNDLFILETGKAVKVVDLAKRMIELSGKSFGCNSASQEGVKIEFTGLRPGEKLYEEFFLADRVIPTSVDGILRGEEGLCDEGFETTERALSGLMYAMDKLDVDGLKRAIDCLVPEYQKSKRSSLDPFWV